VSQKYILTTDDDSHWYVIPADKRDDWLSYVSKSTYYWEHVIPEGEEAPVQPDWAIALGRGPSSVKFYDYEIE
jgi:hypothetical protein